MGRNHLLIPSIHYPEILRRMEPLKIRFLLLLASRSPPSRVNQSNRLVYSSCFYKSLLVRHTVLFPICPHPLQMQSLLSGNISTKRSYKYSCLVLQSPQATRIRALRRVRTFQEQLASILANPLVKLMNRLDSWSDSQPEWNPCSITIQETSHGSTDCDSGQIKLAQL